MTKGYPIFEWSPWIPITDQDDDEHQTEDYEIVSTHGNEDDDCIIKNGEGLKIIEEEAYAKEEKD